MNLKARLRSADSCDSSPQGPTAACQWHLRRSLSLRAGPGAAGPGLGGGMKLAPTRSPHPGLSSLPVRPLKAGKARAVRASSPRAGRTVVVLLADGAWAAGRARRGRGSAPSRPGPSRTRAELRAHAPGGASPARRRDSSVRIIAPWTLGRVSSDSYRDSDMLRSCPFNFAFLHLVPEFPTHQVRSGMQSLMPVQRPP